MPYSIETAEAYFGVREGTPRKFFFFEETLLLEVSNEVHASLSTTDQDDACRSREEQAKETTWQWYISVTSRKAWKPNIACAGYLIICSVKLGKEKAGWGG